MQAFADDVVLVFDGGYGTGDWGTSQCMHVRSGGSDEAEITPHKTCAIVITRRLKYNLSCLSMDGIDIGLSKEINILGLTIDHKLTFHTRNKCMQKSNRNIYI